MIKLQIVLYDSTENVGQMLDSVEVVDGLSLAFGIESRFWDSASALSRLDRIPKARLNPPLPRRPRPTLSVKWYWTICNFIMHFENYVSVS